MINSYNKVLLSLALLLVRLVAVLHECFYRCCTNAIVLSIVLT
jgi:hypothetical protein